MIEVQVEGVVVVVVIWKEMWRNSGKRSGGLRVGRESRTIMSGIHLSNFGFTSSIPSSGSVFSIA